MTGKFPQDTQTTDQLARKWIHLEVNVSEIRWEPWIRWMVNSPHCSNEAIQTWGEDVVVRVQKILHADSFIQDCANCTQRTVACTLHSHTGWCWAQFYEYPTQQQSLWELWWFILWRRRAGGGGANTWQKQSHGKLEKICLLAQICSSLLDWTVTCGGSGNYLTGGKDKKKKLHTQRQRQKEKTEGKDRGQRRESFKKKKKRANSGKGECHWHSRFFIIESSNCTRWEWWWWQWQRQWQIIKRGKQEAGQGGAWR